MSDIVPLMSLEEGRTAGQKITVLPTVTVTDDSYLGDLVLICPMKMAQADLDAQKLTAKDAEGALPKVDGKKVGWDDIITAADCKLMADKIFNKEKKQKNEELLPTSQARLDEAFKQDMTRLEFNTRVIEKLVDILSGTKCSFNVNTSTSADKDELFLCLSMQTNHPIVKQIANSEGYRGRVDPTAYDQAGLPVPKVHQQDAPAFCTYDLEDDEKFTDFNEVDKMRMMRRRMGHFVNLSEAIKYGVIVKQFVAHKWYEVEALMARGSGFGNVLDFYKLPNKNLANVKSYFGEEMAFFFHWFRFYTAQLMLPAALGFIIFWRRWMFELETQRLLQDIYAIFMALWAAQFCENYSRTAIGQATLWGTRNYDNIASVRPQYKEHDKAHSIAAAWSAFGSSVIFTLLALVVCGVVIIQGIRRTMIKHPSENPMTFLIMQYADREIAQKIGGKMGAVMITIQIKLMDAIWGKLSLIVTENENHKTEGRFQQSLVFKTVIVKFFNAMYPFLYFAFAKEYVEGCKGDKGCIPGLQQYIMMFFMTHLVMAFVNLVKAIVMTKKNILQEMMKPGVDKDAYTYLQVQAKCPSFESKDMINDFMELTVQFALVTCFSVVLPVLTVLALISNLVEFRLIAYRQLCLLQRPYPSGAEGIGAWQDIFRAVCFLAILVNAGLAVFAMLPFKLWPMEYKLIAFLVLEHLMLFIKIGVETAIPDLPRDVDNADDKNDEAVARIFGGGFKPINFMPKDLPLKASLWCVPDGEKIGKKYEPFHVKYPEKAAEAVRASLATYK